MNEVLVIEGCEFPISAFDAPVVVGDTSSDIVAALAGMGVEAQLVLANDIDVLRDVQIVSIRDTPHVRDLGEDVETLMSHVYRLEKIDMVHHDVFFDLRERRDHGTPRSIRETMRRNRPSRNRRGRR